MTGVVLLAAVGWTTWTTGVAPYDREPAGDLELRVPSLPPPELPPEDPGKAFDLASARVALYLVVVEASRVPGSGETSFELVGVRRHDVRWPEGRGQRIWSEFEVDGERLEAVFAPSRLYRSGETIGLEYRIIYRYYHDPWRSGGTSSPSHLDSRIRRLFTPFLRYGATTPLLALFPRPQGGVVELWGFLRSVREDDPLTPMAASRFLEAEGFFDRLRDLDHPWPRVRPRTMDVGAGFLPFLYRAQFAGVVLLAAALALAGSSRRRFAGFVAAFLLVVLLAMALDGALVRHHKEKLRDPGSTVAERAIAASGLEGSFFFQPRKKQGQSLFNLVRNPVRTRRQESTVTVPILRRQD